MGFFESHGWRITSRFGNRTQPLKGTPEFHKGIDLIKKHQSPVESFTAGKVMHAKEGVSGSGLGSYGVTVAILDGATGYLHIYAHLDSATVKVGEVVKAGQVIGRQGNTGASAGSHLHYEIRKSSSPAFGFKATGHDWIIDPEVYWSQGHAAQEKHAEAKPVSKPAQPSAQPQASAKSYAIKAGDTLSEVATEHKMSLKQLLDKNPQIKDPGKISIGQKINL